MQQNALHTYWDFDTVDQKLQTIMNRIFEDIYETARSYGDDKNLVKGANILSFKRVYQAMLEQGL
jgi:glutamate dehydrogenase (NADP+)